MPISRNVNNLFQGKKTNSIRPDYLPAYILKIENSMNNIIKYKNDLLEKQEQIVLLNNLLKTKTWDILQNESKTVEEFYIITSLMSFYDEWKDYNFEKMISSLLNEYDRLNLAYKKELTNYRKWKIEQDFKL